MSEGREEYRAHYARLAKEFAETPRVVVSYPMPAGAGEDSVPSEVLVLGQLQVLDLRQDSGYGVGVMLDSRPAIGELLSTPFAFEMLHAERVQLFSDFKEQLLQLAGGVVWDGDLIGKSDRTTLQRLGLAEKVDGWNIITPAGVRECIKAGWLRP